MGSNFLASAREEVKFELTQVGEGQVYDFVPERPSTPCFVISPGAPYLEQGRTFCDFQVRFEVLILSGQATNQTETENLDRLVCEAIDQLETWFIESVEQPAAYEINGATLLGTKVSVTAEKTL